MTPRGSHPQNPEEGILSPIPPQRYNSLDPGWEAVLRTRQDTYKNCLTGKAHWHAHGLMPSGTDSPHLLFPGGTMTPRNRLIPIMANT